MTPLKKYIWLVDTVMRAGEKGLTLQQIAEKYSWNDDVSNGEPYARRTFIRHREEVLDLFGIEIECYNDGSDFRYRIADSGRNGFFRRWLLDSIAVNRIVTDSRDAAQYISVEPTNDTSLPVLLEALKEQHTIGFTYNPFWSESPFAYNSVKPYALKMFERRWYLIALRDTEFRFFALDRMSDVEVQAKTFKRDPKFSLEEMFAGAYGIIVDDTPVESIHLKVNTYQANYLRSVPLHQSQFELKSADDYCVFSLRVRPTFDFKQKLLSFGSSVEVLKPESLRREMKDEIKKMSARNSSDSPRKSLVWFVNFLQNSEKSFILSPNLW